MSIEHSRESAEVEFERFADGMDIDISPDGMDSEELSAFNRTKDRVIKAIQNGNLIIDDEDQAVFTPKGEDAKPLVFHERRGVDIMAMDQFKKNQNMAKTYAVMSSMCRTDISIFRKMAGSDLKVCEAIWQLLMD